MPTTLRTRAAPLDLPALLAGYRRRFADRYPDGWPQAPGGWLTDGVLAAWVALRHGQVLGHVAVREPDRDPLSTNRCCAGAGWQLLAVDARDRSAGAWRVHGYLGPR